MGGSDAIAEDLRERILSEPEAILEDQDLMRALVTANEKSLGGNVVDLRGIAMERLEARLDQLEDTHRSVIAAAYENLAGTNQVHRAVLRMLDPVTFDDFLANLGGDVADILRIDALKFVLEAQDAADDPALRRLGDVLNVVEPGFVDAYITEGRNVPVRQVTLRPSNPSDASVYGDTARKLQSEACIKLDFGEGRLPGMLAMGATDPELFTAAQGTDLLAFFGGVFERQMRRWLS